eukprot:s499_g2.t1
MGGKRQAWDNGEWDNYSQSYAGWGRQGHAAKPQKSRGKGKDQDKSRWAKDEGAFPTYEDIAELEEQTELQEEALDELQKALANPGEDRMDVEEIPSAAHQDWDTLLAEAERVEDLSTLLSGTMCGRKTNGEDGRQRLLRVVAEHRAQKNREQAERAGAGTRTPPRRERPAEAMTPPPRDRPLATRPDGDRAAEADAWLEGARDKGPFPASPTLAGAMPSPTTKPSSRPRATNPRTPVKTHTKPPPPQSSRSSLADKLSEKRAAALEGAAGPMFVESEDEVVASLGQGEPERGKDVKLSEKRAAALEGAAGPMFVESEDEVVASLGQGEPERGKDVPPTEVD